MKLLWASLALGVCAWAQVGPQLGQPQLGMMLAPDGSARAVLGVTGSVTLGAPAASGILSLGCSKLLCLMKTDSSILSLSRAAATSAAATSAAATSNVAAAPEGPAWFSFHGDSALVYFPKLRQLARWHDNQLDPVDFDVPGEILAVRETAAGITSAVRTRGGVWIVGPGNMTLQSLPDATGPVILLDNGVLFATPDAFILRRPGAGDLSFPVDAVASLAWLGEHYVQASTRKSNYALRIDPGAERLFVLPEPAP